MKTLFAVFFTIVLFSFQQVNAQDLQNSRLVYSNVYTAFDHQIGEELDKSKLSSKEEKLNKKFRKKLESQSTEIMVEHLTSSLKSNNVNVLPMDAIIAIKAFGFHGYPAIAFPKKALKKHADKDLSDYFISANLSIEKPVVALAGFKPKAVLTVKIFDKMGVLLTKIKKSVETEKKVSNLGFIKNNTDSFSKIDMDHADWLVGRIEVAIKASVDQAIVELFPTESGTN